jgi:hypothetical protein
MNEQDLRVIVRDAIARHAAAATPRAPVSPAPDLLSVVPRHASHALFEVASGADAGGPCVIEPAVACNHCGYCKSYGH